MGNRAVITNNSRTSVYLHWNGGRASVEAFLDTARIWCKVMGHEGEEITDDLCMVTLHGVCKKYIGKSAYLEPSDRCDTDNGDNGTYIINNNFEIVDRLFFSGAEEIDHLKSATILAEVLSGLTNPEKGVCENA